jgi:excisionase family DNA binding protein
VILVIDSPAVAAHLAFAVRDYIRTQGRDARRCNGLPELPPELGELPGLLLDTGTRGSTSTGVAILPGAELVGIALAARRLGVSVRTVERLVAAGDLAVIHIGGRRLFESRDLRAVTRKYDRPRQKVAS